MTSTTACKTSKLTALLDGELQQDERDDAIKHLLTCEKCRTEYERIRVLSEFTMRSLQTQEGDLFQGTVFSNSAQTMRGRQQAVGDAAIERAWQRLVVRAASEQEPLAWRNGATQSREPGSVLDMEPNSDLQSGNDESKEESPVNMSSISSKTSWWNAKYTRRTSVSAAAVLLIAGLFGTGLGNRVLADAFHAFYVQDVVGLNPKDVASLLQLAQQTLKNGNGKVDLQKYGEIQVSSGGAASTTTLGEAKQLTHYTIPQLPGVQSDATVRYEPQRDVLFRFHVQAINDLLSQVGSKTGLPMSVDNEPIVVHLPSVVEQTAVTNNHDVSLVVSLVPSWQVPEGVNVNDVRETILNTPLLPQDMKLQLAATSDWENTAFLPFPNGTVENVTLNGHTAVLHTTQIMRMVVWVNNGQMYILQGNLNAFPSDAAILATATEIVK